MDKTNLATLNQIPRTLPYPQNYTHKNFNQTKKICHGKIYWKINQLKKITWAKHIAIFFITEIAF